MAGYLRPQEPSSKAARAASAAPASADEVTLLFWPGLAGQFMFYLPATMIATLLM